MKKPAITLLITLTLMIAMSFGQTANAWSNGGYSTDPAQPVYGTHDWIAQHALDKLPAAEKQFIADNLNAFLYGTELPDNSQAPDGIGDTSKHHVYYSQNGQVQDDASAIRANQTYKEALNYLKQKDYANAAKNAGIMTHYIADLAAWPHVMGANTPWGAEASNIHTNYEAYVDRRTDSYTAEYNTYLSTNTPVKIMDAYTTTLNLAKDSTFDEGTTYTCVWMNENYSVDNSAYWNRAGESLNLAVNSIADVLHTLYLEATPAAATTTPTTTPIATLIAEPTTTPTPSSTPTPTQTPSPTQSPTPQVTPTASVPEFPPTLLAVLAIAATATATIALKKKR